MRRSMLAVAGVFIAAATATSCSSSSSAGTAATSPPTVTTAPSASASSAASTGTPPCTGADLAADFQLQTGVQGQAQDEAVGLLALTNTSQQPCSLDGYPKLGFLNEANNEIPVTSTSTPNPGPPESFDVGPGETAFAGANFQIGSGSDASCQTASTLTVYAPGDSTRLETAIGGVHGGTETATPTVCGGVINVGSLQPVTQGVLFS